MGADVNARGDETPLQAICSFDPVSSEEGQQQTQLIKLLLEHGADVNAKATYYTALQYSAKFGRVDIAQFLLKLGALSFNPGQTGYDQALKYWRSRVPVEELIRQHIIERDKLHAQYPGMHMAHQNVLKEHEQRVRKIRDGFKPNIFEYDENGVFKLAIGGQDDESSDLESISSNGD
ncbi:unnamed protein product [Clonostachys rosea]|uniref:Ankyrin repeat protein n=1 Tax=Bionectria ochroleuca TaxID=29856 RepID=A0ABY6UVA3_BIOOC|nr:unnamed protein product [Clonostachys rosea]